MYDATTAATLGGTATVSQITGDVVNVGGTATGTFADKNVGTAKAISVTGVTISGADAGNYNVVQQTGLTANITAAGLPVSGLTTNNKVYDATTAATLGGTATVSPITGDVVNVGGTATGTFADKNVGTAKAISVTGVTISGADAGNYNVVQQTGLTANITVADLPVSGLTASNKVYDATTAATLGGTASVSQITGDVVNVGGTATGTFADKNVGTAKAISVTGVTISGADAGNYNVVQQTGLTANITVADLPVSGLTASNKVYDAITAATLGGTATVSPITGDVVNVGGTATGTFADKNVGTAKAISVTGVTISGADAGNYNVVQQTGLTANITVADLPVSGLTASNKVYDATTAATLGGTATVSPITGDVVNVGGTATGTFADKNVGTAKAISVTGVTISGADAGNYNVVQQTGLTANITVADLPVSGLTASNKVYDATTAATLGGTATVSPITGDVVNVGGTATGTFADKNVGTAKAISVTGVTISGADAGNYNVVQQTGLTANITVADLPVSGLTASNKVYDATTATTLGGTAAVSQITGDVVNVGGTATGTFADKNVGTAKAISVTGVTISGADAGNYNVVQQTGLTANITAANLNITAVDTTRKAGIANPVFRLLYAGFKGTDNATVIDILPTATCAANTSSAAGTYDIVLSGGSDNNYSLVLHNGTLTVTLATAVETVETAKINVFPNPTSDYLFISNLPVNTTISIYNMQGLLIKNSVANGSEKIDVNNLPSGVYLIKLSGSEMNGVVRFVKQ